MPTTCIGALQDSAWVLINGSNSWGRGREGKGEGGGGRRGGGEREGGGERGREREEVSNNYNINGHCVAVIYIMWYDTHLSLSLTFTLDFSFSLTMLLFLNRKLISPTTLSEWPSDSFW